ncbi:MAG: MFS transporter [Ruminococcus sp.]|nr:MFS transporter [Candidatus Apopatosoma intestinale]
MSGNPYQSTVRACYVSYVTQAIVNNLAPLFFVIFQTKYAVSLSELGSLILFNFLTQLLVDFTAVRIGDRVAYRVLLVAAHGSTVIGLCLLGVLPQVMTPFPGLIIAQMFCAVGGGLCEVVVSPLVDALPSDCKEASMSLLHSFYCWGQALAVLLSTLLLSLIGEARWWWIPILWSVVPLYNLFAFLRVPIIQGVPDGTEEQPLKTLLRNRFFYVSLLLMVGGGATELVMAQWSSFFAEKGLGVSKLTGDLLGPCLFAVFMGCGRLFYGLFGQRIRLHRALTFCAALGVVCYLAAALVPNPFVSLAACAITGVAASLMWPGTLSLTSSRFPGGGTSMFALLALCGDLGCSSGPWLTGLVADLTDRPGPLAVLASFLGFAGESTGLRVGILVGALFPLLSLLLLLVTRKKNS